MILLYDEIPKMGQAGNKRKSAVFTQLVQNKDQFIIELSKYNRKKTYVVGDLTDNREEIIKLYKEVADRVLKFGDISKPLRKVLKQRQADFDSRGEALKLSANF